MKCLCNFSWGISGIATSQDCVMTLVVVQILAPLTRGGNVPFRRLCADFGAEVTMSEMCFARMLLKGEPVEKSRLRKAANEQCFGGLLSDELWSVKQTLCPVAVTLQCNAHLLCKSAFMHNEMPLPQIERGPKEHTRQIQWDASVPLTQGFNLQPTTLKKA